VRRAVVGRTLGNRTVNCSLELLEAICNMWVRCTKLGDVGVRIDHQASDDSTAEF
jgi:hypothetical protein